MSRRGTVNVALRMKDYEQTAASAFDTIKAHYPYIQGVSEDVGYHISLTRPSLLPSHLEQPVLSQLSSIFASTEAFDVYMRGSVDAFLTESGNVAFGITVDQTVSHTLMRLLNQVNDVVIKYGLLPFHDTPNMHITVAVLPSELATDIKSSETLIGPEGSQFIPGIFPLPSSAAESVICSSVAIRVGLSQKVIALIS